jgi:sugar transferase EpsL
MVRLIYASIGKRALDLVVAVPTLIILAPYLLITAIFLIFNNNSESAFFCQRRPGLKGKPFIIYKFRSMTDISNTRSQSMPDADRLTKFGRFLRRASLDELPELWNVLMGDMSLVGPRPLLIQYLERYTPEQARRHEVKPGITGWAQVNGRNAITWENKFKLDVWYVDHVSLKLDMKILWMTFIKVLKREGISAEGHATMPEFLGTKAGRNEN